MKSSSSAKTGIVSVRDRNVVRIDAVRIGHGALITGVPANSRYVLFDMQGHVVASGVGMRSGIVLDRISAGRFYLVVGSERFVVDISVHH